MIEEAFSLSVVGLGFALLLVWASRKFAVEIDEKLEEVRGRLPGSNCGACGFKGCADYAKELVRNPNLVDRCRVLAPAERRALAAYLGVKETSQEWMAALSACSGGSKKRFEYAGERRCTAAHFLAGGPTSCRYSCLGFGDCEKACPFGAIRMVNDLPEVDWRKCKGCGLCAKACPRGVIIMVPRNAKVYVKCISPETGKGIATSCLRGCIKCRLCERNCPRGAIKFVSNRIFIDPTICDGCGKCVEVCPRKCIHWIQPTLKLPAKI